MYKSVALLFDPDNPWIFDYFDKNKIDTENTDIKHYFDIEKVKGFDFVFLLGNTMRTQRSVPLRTFLYKHLLASDDSP